MPKPIRGFVPKKKLAPLPDLAGSVDGVVKLVSDLTKVRTTILETVDEKLSEVDSFVSEVKEEIGELNQSRSIIAEKIQEIDTTVAAVSQYIEDTKNEAIEVIKEIKQGEQGVPGKDADEEGIYNRLLEKIPPSIDVKKLKKEFLSAIPNRKADLKIIQESIDIDPMSVIDKIMALPPEKRKKLQLDQGNISGLQQTMSAFSNQLGRGYLHGGGISNITGLIEAGTNITIDGTGTSGDPYIINSTGGSGGSPGGFIYNVQTNNGAGGFSGTDDYIYNPDDSIYSMGFGGNPYIFIRSNSVGLPSQFQFGDINGTGSPTPTASLQINGIYSMLVGQPQGWEAKIQDADNGSPYLYFERTVSSSFFTTTHVHNYWFGDKEGTEGLSVLVSDNTGSTFTRGSTVSLGDNASTFNQSLFILNDGLKTLTYTVGTNLNYLLFDVGNQLYQIGDLNSSGNDTQFWVDDRYSAIRALANDLFEHTNNSGNHFFISNPSLGQYSTGDIDGIANHTSTQISDPDSTYDINGFRTISYAIIPFTGTGLDDLTWDGTYTGIAGDNFNVWIDSIGNATINYTPPSSPSGLALSGTVDNGAGVTATVVSDDTLGTLVVTNTVGGSFSPGDTLTDGSGNSIVIDGVTPTPDTFAWQDTLGGSGSMIVVSTSPTLLANGITVQWAADTGHDIGSISAGWEEDISFSRGRMLANDGQNHTGTMGDVDGVGNDTKFFTEDEGFRSGVTNRWVGGMTTSDSTVTANILTVRNTGNKTFFKSSGVNLIESDGWTEGSEIVVINIISTTYRHNQTPAGSALPMLLAGSGDCTLPVNSRLTFMLAKKLNAWLELARTST